MHNFREGISWKASNLMAQKEGGSTRPYWRLWWGLAESAFVGNTESGVRRRFCVGAFGSHREDVFTLNLPLKKFYTFCTFYVICKDNDAISRSQWPCGLRRGSWPDGCWDRGFESRSRHGCLSLVFLCCVVLCR
jgi:hypothetical protein